MDYIRKTPVKLLVLLAFCNHTYAQTITNKKGSKYRFTVEKEISTTGIKNQFRSNTCWSFSTQSFLESELIRMGKGNINLSEMYVVRRMYSEKADQYLRRMGKANFAAGGEPHDVMNTIREYGIVPREAYPGLSAKDDKPEHFEMDGVLKAMMDEALKLHDDVLSPEFRAAINAVLDTYLGKVPEKFDYNGKSYTPKTFAQYLGIHPDDYVEITSFTHHPFYEKFILEVPDNWNNGQTYNLPLNELQRVAENAVMNGYSIGWESDVSEPGFNFKSGLAIVPARNAGEMSKEEKDSLFLKPVPEKKITQELRQEAFDNLSTQDDHGMHIIGLVKDQNNQPYFIVKNSWGKDNDCGGFFYCSMPYFLYKTTCIMVNKNAIPKDIAHKLHLD